MAEQIKTIGEIFRDYSGEENITKANITKINLFKKSNKLEIDLFSKVYIQPNELLGLDKYLQQRFGIENIEINMQYDKEITLPEITKQWKQIVKYMAYKYPFTEFLLHNSKVEITDKMVKVFIVVKGADFLEARGFDIALEKTLKSLYAKVYKVTYVEDLQEEEIKKLEQTCKLTQEYEIEKAISEMSIQEETIEPPQEELKNKIQEQKEEKTNEISPKEQIEQKTPLILGRNANIKDTLVKVSEISIDSGKIALEGEILNVDSRQLKSGKYLVLFDVYDGTSTITCKAFVEEEKAANVLARLQHTKSVRISGTAQFDPFAKEIGIIANIIIEVPECIPR